MAVDAGRSSDWERPQGALLRSRVYGFGGLYAKSLRDSRVAFLVCAGLLGGIMLAVSSGIARAYGTAAARAQIVKLVSSTPSIAQGLTGRPVNVGTIGGYVAWKYGPDFVLVTAIWSILALSGALAGEAQRGSLDLLAATSVSKRRLALDKLAAHLTALVAAMSVLALAAWLAGVAFGELPGDAIPPQAAIGFAAGVGLLGLVSGAVAFALAPFLGRSAAAGVAGVVLFAGYLVNGYKASVPAFSGVAHLSWFDWTANHLPLAGRYDWVSLVPVALVAMALLWVGSEAFTRRDLGARSVARAPSLPDVARGLRDPLARSVSERLPIGLAWGLGLGAFGFVIAAASRSWADALAGMSPNTVALFRRVFPHFDITSAGGFLQVVFVQLGFIVAGFAAVTLVAGWASDESSGRFEMLLAAPVGRRRMAASSGTAVYLVIAVMTAVLACAVGLGAMAAGSGVVTPMLGSITLGLYAVAVAGVGLAVGGLYRMSVAAEVAALVVVLTFLLDLVVPALKLPDWVHQLALTGHLGQPMVGSWDATGVVTCLALAAGGLALGVWGFARRELRG